MTSWHDPGALASPTRAEFRGRLEAIGLGRWASLFTGACKSREVSVSREGRWRS